MWSDDSEVEEAPIRKRKVKHFWSKEDTAQIIKLWGQNAFELRGNKRKSHIFDEMSEKMDGKFSRYEIHMKIKNLISRYRIERRKAVTLSKPSDWPLFDQVHEIFGKHRTPNFQFADSNSETQTNFDFVDSVMEGLIREEDHHLVEMGQEDLLAHNRALLNRNLTLCSEENNTTQDNYHSTEASKRFKSRMEEDDGAENSSRTLSKLADTVNNVVGFIIKTDAGKSRNDSFLKLMDSYLLKLPEDTQDTLIMDILDMVFNKVKDEESIREQ